MVVCCSSVYHFVIQYTPNVEYTNHTLMYVGLTGPFSSNTNLLIQVNIFDLSFQIQKYGYLSSPCLKKCQLSNSIKKCDWKIIVVVQSSIRIRIYQLFLFFFALEQSLSNISSMFQLHFSKQEEFATSLEIVQRKIVTRNTHRSDYLHI